MPSLSMILGGLVKRPITGSQSKLMIIWWGLLLILMHAKI